MADSSPERSSLRLRDARASSLRGGGDDQTYDEIEMVDRNVVEAVGRAGLGDSWAQIQMDMEEEAEEGGHPRN